jgi:Pyruvate/2-oxoacid:ferredoxin oxidoreductase delta subunit
MEGNGPSAGEIRKLDMIAACSDAAVLDAYLMNALGYDVSKNHILNNLKVSKKDIDSVEIAGNSLTDFNLSGFKMPKTRILDSIPPSIVKVLGKLLWIRPYIDKKICVKCFLCANSCPAKAISARADKFPFVDAKKCISCFCCHEMCPYKAIDFKKSFLAGLFIEDDRKKTK